MIYEKYDYPEDTFIVELRTNERLRSQGSQFSLSSIQTGMADRAFDNVVRCEPSARHELVVTQTLPVRSFSVGHVVARYPAE